MKIAMIGVGGMGGLHYDCYKQIEDAEVIAACDIRLDMLREKTAGDNVRLYADYKEMLENEKPDMIDICTPTYLHMEHAIAALESGAHVLCEKPMALTHEQTLKMLDTAKRKGKLLMVAQVVRFMTAYSYLRDVIRSEKYGKLIHMDMKRLSGTPCWGWEDWFRDEQRSGLVTTDLMVHDIDYMQSIFGNPKDINGIYQDLRENNNYAQANYIYDDFTVSITGTFFNADFPFDAGVTAVFQNGYVILDNGKINDNGTFVSAESVLLDRDTGMNISNVDGYSCEIQYFMDCIKNGTQPLMATPESSSNSIYLVEETRRKLTPV